MFPWVSREGTQARGGCRVGVGSRSTMDDSGVTDDGERPSCDLSLRGNNAPTVSKLCRSVQDGEKRRGGGDY